MLHQPFAHFPNAKVQHFVSQRSGGYSRYPYQSLNLGLHVGDHAPHVIRNRQLLAAKLKLSPEDFVFAQQSHENQVHWIKQEDGGSGFFSHKNAIPQTDAFICNLRGICPIILTADCVSIFLYDPEHHAIGLVHAGWRGTVARLTESVIVAMHGAFDTKPQSLMAGIGPSISPEHYEVGPEVIEAVRESFGTTIGLVEAKANGKGMLNLWEANRQILLENGLQFRNIKIAGECSYQQNKHYFSARKEGTTGRFASGMILL